MKATPKTLMRLIPMRRTEFDQFVASHEEEYAQERSRNLETTIDEERKVSRKQYAEITRYVRPRTVRADGMEVAGKTVGCLVPSYDRSKRRSYLHYIVVFEEYRRKGYARAALELLEEEAKGLGAQSVSLNVFGDNGTAKLLYEKSGYQYAFHGMHKKLRREP